ncbi:ABC transporter ATP-binding protein [Kordiimonas pumila]|uniref:ABC transporter ATP-binding protein n=1 Tax=Kordiimonas pumila TaxID=2161677 RepID=A0ABV7D6G4_9PROT|nr:ABC transporter ATP-binding protein [Kordiimonas pumila]
MTGLELKNISATLEGMAVLSGVSFAVKPGEVVGLIGPNGAGKTTVLKAALGLLPLVGGTVFLDGQLLEGMNAKDRACKVAYVPQGAPVHWPLTAERTVALGRIPHISPWQNITADDTAAIEKAMRVTDCWKLRDRLVTTLSGGERARVLLARAIAVNAYFLLADEPTASLDPAHQLQVMEILKEQASNGVGAVVVMHDLALAARTCDRLILICEGRVLAAGTPGHVLTDANIQKAFHVSVSRWKAGGVDMIAPIARIDS